MRYMREPITPELEQAPELSVMYILEHNLKALQDAVFATDRNLFEDWDFQPQNGQSAATHLCKAIIDHTEALRISIAAYQKSLDAHKSKKVAELKSAIF
jgi:hypothetical protein